MEQKLIIKNPRMTNIDASITYQPDLLFNQVKAIIERELMRRGILVDMVEINFKRSKMKELKGGLKE